MSINRIIESFNNKNDNYILPFFWQHGEPDDVIIEEIHAIYNSGAKALCIESRHYDGFATDAWWHTLDIIFAECEKLDMKVWLLDDSSFPTGHANGAYKNHPELAACGITEQHVDVTGPVINGAVHIWRPSADDELIAVLACESVPQKEALTGKIIDLSSNVIHDDLLYFDLPEGGYRIMFFYKTRTGMGDWGHSYADMLSEKSIDLLIEAVYEEHYKHYKKYFGNVFQGFFSDEPCLGNNSKNSYIPNFGIKYCHFPWRSEFLSELDEKINGNFKEYLPALWFDIGPNTARARYEYMDMITKRFSRAFSWKIGNWCRAHGVMYIGHVIEDKDQHTKTGMGDGHYFRALDGQDMGGIDTVLCQNTPGQTDYVTRIPCSYDVADPNMFSFTLPKLAPSHAHIQPLKKGRAMCEIFGAYGWLEGTKMMKWMADLMLVSGINYYIPHAFSPTFPDQDCPPHFYARGTNPEFDNIRPIIDYMNRMSHLISQGVHVPCAAIYYHAETEWSDNSAMPCDTVARILTENQLDFDIIPTDYLANASCNKNNCTFTINKESYHCLILPECSFIPSTALDIVCKYASNNVPVIFINTLPIGISDKPNDNISEYIKPYKNIFCLTCDELAVYLRTHVYADITAQTPSRHLRYYHYEHDNTKLYMFMNTDINHDINTLITLEQADVIGDYAIYDAFENKLYKAHSNTNSIPLHIKPYNSIVYIFGEIPQEIPYLTSYEQVDIIEFDENYSVSIAQHTDLPNFTHYANISRLKNMASHDELPHFSGHFKYEKSFTFESKIADAEYILDLGNVGECAKVILNGRNCGNRIFPPYEFNITNALKKGSNSLEILVTNNYGFQMRDGYSKFLLFEPTGLLGKVSLKTIIQKN